MVLGWNVHIHPFRFLRVRECSVYKENGAIVSAKFALMVEDGADERCLKESLTNQRAEFLVNEDFSAGELEEICAALKSFDVMAVERVLHVNGITDVLSIHQMRKMECFLPVLLGAYDDAREEILSDLPFFQTLTRLQVDEPLGSLGRMNGQGFFRSWDREILYREMKRQRVFCKGMLGKLTLRVRQKGRVLTGVIDTAARLPASEIGIPVLERASNGWVNLTRGARNSVVHTPPLFT